MSQTRICLSLDNLAREAKGLSECCDIADDTAEVTKLRKFYVNNLPKIVKVPTVMDYSNVIDAFESIGDCLGVPFENIVAGVLRFN